MMRELPSTLETALREDVSRYGLADFYQKIRGYARLTFLMPVTPVNDWSTVPLGSSRFGGTPDLPANQQWACNPEDGLLLDFIGQINLADLPPCGQTLPASGLLQIYSQQESASDNVHTIQLILAPVDSLIRAAIPKESSFSDEDSDEPFGSLMIPEFVPSVSLPYSLPSILHFEEMEDAYSELLQELTQLASQTEPVSQLLGYPYDPFTSHSLSEERELLIEVQSHFDHGNCYLNFWDAGSLQILVQSNELQSCRFSNSTSMILSH